MKCTHASFSYSNFICASFNYSNFINIIYFFWNLNTRYCGHTKFMFDCQNGRLSMEMMSQKIYILHINESSQVLRIARDDLSDFHQGTNCNIEGKFHSVYIVSSSKLVDFSAVKCKNSIEVPGKNNSLPNKSSVMEGILVEGFEVRWNGVGEDRCHACTKYGGRSGYNREENAFMCLSKRSATSKVPSRTWNWKKKLILGVISNVFATLVVITSIYFYKRHNIHSRDLFLQPFRLDSQRISKSQNFGVEHFIFKNLYKATNNFDKKLGDGDSAEVFNDKLLDGREVAVKRLFKFGLNKEQLFLKEINILARTIHPNLILLYGCTSLKSRRALIVYEYVRNGSLDDHLHGDKATPNSCQQF
ncbi:LEAF RUST 10 DISEASE-RESISTANCE LOCUS RECEPTOR-LIKE PROTEIN KINASE-like 1.2 isoform X2 [Lathyrus oleraceus]|uniref:non-specific serine/threonine protein kinase n=2 Tax=Pisum sativum TaxID=3888 RepID=A0A9D4YQ26_PEA|nr:LEAF RUST 10 DISEASE-RESISTANCE LOCUS RECEPTOR-LIKE PROTEIN KINASE-like 1.2 isoform X2 [Pisum sativum]KAI5441676.1 hypothetical protein KIW84_010938 [Pisum sativum]